MIFREITDSEVAFEASRAPCPVRFVEGLDGWGSLDHVMQVNPKLRLYRLRPEAIEVRADLRNEEKMATIVHETAHARDMSRPAAREHLLDVCRAEAVAYRETLRELLDRGLYLPLVAEMHAIEWDAEGQGNCIHHQSAAATVRNSPIWQECRTALMQAMNEEPLEMKLIPAVWEGHGPSWNIKAGRNYLVVEIREGRVTDFQIAKFWAGGGPIQNSATMPSCS